VTGKVGGTDVATTGVMVAAGGVTGSLAVGAAGMTRLGGTGGVDIAVAATTTGVLGLGEAGITRLGGNATFAAAVPPVDPGVGVAGSVAGNTGSGARAAATGKVTGNGLAGTRLACGSEVVGAALDGIASACVLGFDADVIPLAGIEAFVAPAAALKAGGDAWASTAVGVDLRLATLVWLVVPGAIGAPGGGVGLLTPQW
jgi:hypothetical protein